MSTKYRSSTSIGDKIKNLRIGREMTQQQVAAFIPMNQANYSKIERNAQEPNLLQLKRIALLFNVSTDSLLDIKLAHADDTSYEQLEQEDTCQQLRKELDDLFDRYFKSQNKDD